MCLLSIPIAESFGPCHAADKANEQEQTKSPGLQTSYKPSPETAESRQGKRIFAEHHCAVCHTSGKSGGCLGPPLLGVGARRSKDFILARITNEPVEIRKFTSLYAANELMPHPRLPRKLSAPLAVYLMTLPEPEGGFKIGSHAAGYMAPRAALNKAAPSQASIKKGKQLFYERGCTACHSVYGTGGQFAPSLDGVSKRLGREKIVGQITKAELLTQGSTFEYNERGTVMPPSNLNAAEIQAITDFLLSIPAKR